MRFLLLAMLAASIAAADVRQLGPNEDLSFCRVTISMDGPSGPVLKSFDGWWSADTLQLFPLDGKALSAVESFDPQRVVHVQPAVAQPGRMPAAVRKQRADSVAALAQRASVAAAP